MGAMASLPLAPARSVASQRIGAFTTSVAARSWGGALLALLDRA